MYVQQTEDFWLLSLSLSKKTQPNTSLGQPNEKLGMQMHAFAVLNGTSDRERILKNLSNFFQLLERFRWLVIVSCSAYVGISVC